MVSILMQTRTSTPVRCNVSTPSPYLVRWEAHLRDQASGSPWNAGLRAADLGAGNGRNTQYLKKCGWRVASFDASPAFSRCNYARLGQDFLPIWDDEAMLVLIQYVFMFLNPQERSRLMCEAMRMTGWCGKILIELYPAKDSFTPTQKDCDALQKELIKMLGKDWHVRHNVKNKFIAERMPPNFT